MLVDVDICLGICEYIFVIRDVIPLIWFFFFFWGLPCIVVSIHVFLLFFIFFDVWMMLVVFVGSVEFFFIMIHWCVVLSYTAVFNELSFVKVVAVLTVNLICN